MLLADIIFSVAFLAVTCQFGSQESTNSTTDESYEDYIEGASRISLGHDVIPGQYPSFVSLTDGGLTDWVWPRVSCNGALISDQLVITSRLCSSSKTVIPTHFSSPLNAINHRSRMRKVIDYCYIGDEAFGITILRLDEPIEQGNEVVPIGLASRPVEEGDTLFFVGDGRDENLSSVRSYVKYNVGYATRCKESQVPDTEYRICIKGTPDGGKVCEADVGGPVYRRRDSDWKLELVGIVHTGAEYCNELVEDSVFTHVALYSDYILEQLKSCRFIQAD